MLALFLTTLIKLYTLLLARDDARDGARDDTKDDAKGEAKEISKEELDHKRESQNDEDLQSLTVKSEDIEDDSQEMKKLPEIAVVGVKKCGTGALIEMLRMHPDIIAPPYAGTEIKFWGEEDTVSKGLEYNKVNRNTQ